MLPVIAMCNMILFWLLLSLISLAAWGRQCLPKRYLKSSDELSLTVVCYPSYYAELTWDNGDFQAESVLIHSSCYNNTTEMLQEQIIDSSNQGDFSSSTTVPAEQWDRCDFSGCYIERGVGRYFKLTKVSCTWPVTEFDECSYGIHSCSINANCTDTSDSYDCTCHDGYEGTGTTCTNINECERNLSNCDSNAKCSDTNGSFECNCTSGYRGNGYNCTNIDECTLGTHTCHYNATCTDTAGEFNCTCKSGFEGDGINCTNINECMTNSHNCHQNAICSDTVGGFECKCTEGYEGDGVLCTNIDECMTNGHDCHQNAICSDTVGGFECNCTEGYEGDGIFCTNIDECMTNGHNCHENAICSDTVGGFECNCTEGYEGDGVLCTNINECNENPCHANATCIDYNGSYVCHCNNGYTGDGKDCTNIDECERDNHECHLNATCTDTEGSYNCTCNIGFKGDGFKCAELSGVSMPVIIVLITGLTVAVMILVTVIVIILVVCVLRLRRHDDEWFLGSKERVSWESELVPIVTPTYPSMTTLVSVFDILDFESAKESMNSRITNKPETLIGDSSEPVNSQQLNEYILSEGCSSEHEYAAVDGESSKSTLSTSARTGTINNPHKCFQTDSEPNNDIMSEGKHRRMSEYRKSKCNERTWRESSTTTALNQEGIEEQSSSSSSSSSTYESVADGRYVIFVDVQSQ